MKRSISGSSDFLQRFWSRVVVTADGCWEWRGARTKSKWSYGLVAMYHLPSRRRCLVRAHRLAFMLYNGVRVPDDLEVLHRCDNPPCCRPTHLFVGTQADNVADMVAKGRNYVGGTPIQSHCRRGHPLTAGNVRHGCDRRVGRPKRQCRTCYDAAHRRYLERQSA